MSEEKDKTAIEVIYQIAEDIRSIKQHLILLDNNIKLISNKLNKIDKSNQEAPAVKPVQKITATPGTPPPPQSKKAAVQSDELVLGNIKVHGKIVNKEKKPITGVEVNIYNSENEVIKKRKTDKDGYWEVRLPVGKYGVEYIQDGYKPINRSISLNNSTNSFEVS